jgi:hypothetical protein
MTENVKFKVRMKNGGKVKKDAELKNGGKF